MNATLYRSLTGSLINLTTTRPDIMCAVSLVSLFHAEPHEFHWRAAKNILGYVSGTSSFGIMYSSSVTKNMTDVTVHDGKCHFYDCFRFPILNESEIVPPSMS